MLSFVRAALQVHPRLLARRLQLCARALVLLLGLQVSGFAAVAVQLAAGDHACTACCDECPLDREGRECPPSCPDCHCAHGSAGALPRTFSDAVLQAFDQGRQQLGSYDGEASPRPSAVRGVYRPPRAAASCG